MGRYERLRDTWYTIYTYMTLNSEQQKMVRTNIVTYAPALFFVMMLVGVVIHINAPTEFIDMTTGWVIGLVLLLVSPVLIFWSLRIRHSLYVPVIERTCTNFGVGPYRFSRHPVYGGFLLMMIGFGFVINSVIMLLFSAILFVLFTGIIIPEEERELSKHCPEVYADYMKKVRMWM